MTTITGTLIGHPNPTSVTVTATLVDLNGTQRTGYVTSQSGQITTAITTTPSRTGVWSLDLTPNTNITSDYGDTLWRISEGTSSDYGKLVSTYITVPASGGPYWVGAQRTDPPGGAVQASYAVLSVNGHTGAVTGMLEAANNLSDLGAASTARANLGLGGAAVLNVGTTDGTVAGGDNFNNLPSDQGLLAWTYDPDMAGHVTAQSSGGVAGRITLTRIIIRKAITWSSIWFGLSGVDAGASLANCYLGVYDTAGTLQGTTADISASLSSGAVAKSVALAAPFSATAGTYFIAMLLNGTWTTNSFTFKCSGAGSSVNANLSAPNLRYSNMLTAQTSLPASLDLNSQTTTVISSGWASQWYGVS